MKKNGFTLVEMLAVLIILALITLIVNPIIRNSIADSRKKVNLESANGIKNAAYSYYLDQIHDLSNVFNGYVCDFSTGCKLLSHDGQTPTEGYIYVSFDGNVNGSFSFKNYKYYICDNQVSDTDCKYDNYSKIYDISVSGVINGFKKNGDVLTSEAENIKNSSILLIPSSVGTTIVKSIASNAFNLYDISTVVFISKNNITATSTSFGSSLKKVFVPEKYYSNYSTLFSTYDVKLLKMNNQI